MVKKTNSSSTPKDAKKDGRDSCFYSIVLLSQFSKQSVGRPHLKAQLWMHFEKNYEYSDSDNIASTHHIEVYRGQTHQHRVELRIWFTLLVLFEIFRRKKSFKVITFNDFRPLIIFVWLSLVSFSPETKHPNPWVIANEAVTSSAYLVVVACSLGLNAMLDLPRVKVLTPWKLFIAVSALACVIYLVVHYFSSPFLFSNGMRIKVLQQMGIALTSNLLVRSGLRKFEAVKHLDPASKLLAVVVVHTIVLIFSFFIFFNFPPDHPDHDCEFKLLYRFRFMFIRWIEVCMRSFVMRFFIEFICSAGARAPSKSSTA
jgi:hypothetical protein